MATNSTSKNDISAEKYCYSIAESAVHYSGKADEWTPNNIKRLIISPDMVVVQLHTSTRFISKQFVPNKYAMCVCQPKYKKMVSVLGGDGNNVCSHVEEIIYCLQGENGGYLHNEEANLRSILMRNSGVGNEAMLIKELGNRFKRLYAVCQFSGTVRQLINGVGNKMLKDTEYHVADESNVNATLIHKDDWYKGFFFRPASYPADRDGGKLFNHLHKVSADIEKRLQDDKTKNARESYIGELKTKVQKEVDTFKSVFTCSQRLCVMCLKGTAKSYFSQVELDGFDKRFMTMTNMDVTLTDPLSMFTDSFKESLKRSGVRITESKGDVKEEAVKFGETIHILTMKLYESMQKVYVDLFNTLIAKYPLTMKSYFKDKSCKINMLSGMEVGSADRKIAYEKASLKVSTTNMCCHIVGICLNDELRDKYSSAEVWNGYFDKAVSSK